MNGPQSRAPHPQEWLSLLTARSGSSSGLAGGLCVTGLPTPGQMSLLSLCHVSTEACVPWSWPSTGSLLAGELEAHEAGGKLRPRVGTACPRIPGGAVLKPALLGPPVVQEVEDGPPPHEG